MHSPTCLLIAFSFLAGPLQPPIQPPPTQARTVRVGIYQNEPKVFLDEQGAPSGIFVDLIRRVADLEGWRLEFVPGTWAEGLNRLEEGRIDLMPDVAFSDERATRFDLGRSTVISDWFELFAARDSGIESFSDLEGKRVAVVDQSIQETVLGRTLGDLGLTVSIIPVGDHEAVMRAIESDDADCGVVNRFFAATKRDKYRVAPTSIVFYPTRLVFATTK